MPTLSVKVTYFWSRDVITLLMKIINNPIKKCINSYFLKPVLSDFVLWIFLFYSVLICVWFHGILNETIVTFQVINWNLLFVKHSVIYGFKLKMEALHNLTSDFLKLSCVKGSLNNSRNWKWFIIVKYSFLNILTECVKHLY